MSPEHIVHEGPGSTHVIDLDIAYVEDLDTAFSIVEHPGTAFVIAGVVNGVQCTGFGMVGFAVKE